MKFKKKSFNESMDAVILMKEKSGGSRQPGEEGDEFGDTIVFEGLNIGYCGVNDTVPGCAC